MLERSLRSPSWRQQHSAAVILLNYGFGKPVQLIGQDPQAPLQLQHLVAARAMSEQLHSRLIEAKAQPTEDEPRDLMEPATE
jgi:hypothetical protein